jgi:glycosyltransferase involved in cell wall biosynthesis
MSPRGTAEPCIAMLCPGGLEHSGGIGRWAGYLQAAWRERGILPDLQIVDTRGHGGYWVGLVSFLKAVVTLVWLRATRRLVLIHSNVSIRGSTIRKYLIGKLAVWLGVPLILHLHGSGYDAFYGSLPGGLRRRVVSMFARADTVVVLGDYWRDFLVREVGVPSEKIVKIFNAVTAPRTSANRRAAGPCHIVMLGRLGDRKGVPELLTAMASPILRSRAWRSTLAGDGEIDRFRDEAARLGLGERIGFPGWIDAAQAAALLASADILVLPSHEENLPIALLEALAYGVPVVTTPVGAIPELIEDGVTGRMVPVGDVDALAAALAQLVDDADERHRLGDAGHALFLSQLDISAAVDRFDALYRSVLDPHPQLKQYAADGIAG